MLFDVCRAAWTTIIKVLILKLFLALWVKCRFSGCLPRQPVQRICFCKCLCAYVCMIHVCGLCEYQEPFTLKALWTTLCLCRKHLPAAMKQNWNSYLAIFSFMYTQSAPLPHEPPLQFSCMFWAAAGGPLMLSCRRGTAEKAGTRHWKHFHCCSLYRRAIASNSLPAAPRLTESCFSTHVPSSCTLVAAPSTCSPSLVLCFSSTLTPQRLHAWTSWRVT